MENTFRSARERAGLTPQEAAQLLGVSYATIRKYETDPAKPSHMKPAPLVVKVLDWYERKVPPSL